MLQHTHTALSKHSTVDSSWVEVGHTCGFVLHFNIEHILDGHNHHILHWKCSTMLHSFVFAYILAQYNQCTISTVQWTAAG